MEEFEFTNTCRISKKVYVEVYSSFKKYRLSKIIRIILGLVLGVLFLFWSYTFLLGVSLVLLTISALFAPSYLPKGLRSNYKEVNYLQNSVEYGFNQDKCWAKGEGFTSEAEWKYYKVWRERQGWILIQGNGFVPIFLPVSKLKKQNLYKKVIELANQHAVQF